MRTYRLRGTGSRERGVGDAVLQHISGGRLPAHIHGVCGGVVNLDVLGRGPRHCFRQEREQHHKNKDSKRGERLEWLKRYRHLQLFTRALVLCDDACRFNHNTSFNVNHHRNTLQQHFKRVKRDVSFLIKIAIKPKPTVIAYSKKLDSQLLG